MAGGTFQWMNGVGRLASRLAAAILLSAGLSACAIPPAISIASMAADGVLLAATGKSKADHGLSLATGKDCSTLRGVIDGEDVCQEMVLAQAEPLPAEIDRELAQLRAAPKPAVDEAGRHGTAALAAAFHPRVAPPLVLAPAAPRPVAAAGPGLAQAAVAPPAIPRRVKAPLPVRLAMAAP